MGTRSITILEYDDGPEIAVLYRQFDGYPEGHGAELAEFLSGFETVNGYTSGNQKKEKVANGGACLAAQLVGHFKAASALGGIYLYPAGSRDCGEEYRYTVTPGNPVRLRCETDRGDGWATLYDGAPEGFDPDNLKD